MPPAVGAPASHAVPLEPLNLGRLQDWIDQGKVDPSKPITMRDLYGPGRLTKIKHGVKLLGDVRCRRGRPPSPPHRGGGLTGRPCHESVCRHTPRARSGSTPR